MQNWKKSYCVLWNLPVKCHSVQLKTEYMFKSFYVASRISEFKKIGLTFSCVIKDYHIGIS